MDLTKQVADFILHENLLQPGQRLVIGVSGGPDSLCLLDCLNRLGYQIIVAHLDHQLRPESSDEASFVRRVAQTYGLKVEIESQDIGAAVQAGSSLEETARLLRYGFLVRVAKAHQTEVIATGHTADDQVETILMHFLRGAGPSGLRGMLPKTPMQDWVGVPNSVGINLVRPLLETTREQIQVYCTVNELEPRQDASNLDLTFTRNRLRHHLVPILESYNPGVKRVLRRMGYVMLGEAELISELVDGLWSEIVRERSEEVFSIQKELFMKQPVALKRALIREAICRLRPSQRDLGFEVVERALDYVSGSQLWRRQVLLGNLEMLNLEDEIILQESDSPIVFPEFPQLTSDRRRKLSVPGRARLASGWLLDVTVEDLNPKNRGEFMKNSGGRVAAIDEQSIKNQLALRPRKPGDRIRPLGLRGSTKISDLLINQQIPHPARARWPLVVSGNHIVWVVGLRMSDTFRLNETTKRAIILRLICPQVGMA